MEELDKITDFVIKYSSYTKRDELRERIKKHLEFNTCIYAVDKKGDIFAVCLWNVEDFGRVAHIIDFMVREDYRNNGMIKTTLAKGLLKYPTVTHLKWERRNKYPERPMKFFSVDRMLQ